jgi:hypothetical protein
MRAILSAVLLLAACEPDIAPGSYLCGPEQLCPEGLACNGSVDPNGDGKDNQCVVPSAAKPFECGSRNNEVPGDDAPATAQSLGELACVSLVRETRGCLPAGDVGDFYTFTVAAGCTNVRVNASVVYPVAWQELVLQLGKVGESPVTIDTPCAASRAADEGDAVSCLQAPVAPGTYTLGVIPAGTGNCDNECRFNRYGLAVQVTTI